MAMKQSGFSLVELLVGVGIVGIIGVLVVQVFFSTLRSNSKTEIRKEVKQNGDLALETMARLIQGAREVNSSCSSSGTTTTELVLVDTNGETMTFGCILDGSVTRLASTSGTVSEYLTSKSVSLGGSACANSTISFTCRGVGGAPPRITISFTLSQVGQAGSQFEQSSSSFQSSVSLRNSVQ